jgi:hypothetical protein
MRAFIKAFFTLTGFALLSLAILANGTLTSQVIAVVVLIAGFFASTYVYRLVLKRPSSDLSRFATPDLDNLIPVSGSGISEVTPQQLCDYFSANSWKLNNAELKIWGDWQNKSLDSPKTVKSISYEQSFKKLTIDFRNGQLQIINPRNIHLASHLLKILFADKVLWNWNSTSSLIYYKTGNQVERKTNVALNLDKLDIDSTQPALLIK